MSTTYKADMRFKAIPALRRIIAITVSPTEARGIVADQFHHFRVAVRHEGGVITQVSTEAPRVPYTLCPTAGDRLKELVGVQLTRRVTDIHGHIDGRHQCTHQFDLAAMVVTAAARGEDRTYRIVVTDPVEAVSSFFLHRDDGLTVEWEAREGEILSPPPFAGANMRKGFTDWASRKLDEDMCEAALALRRTDIVSRGRRIMDELNELGHARPNAGCWVQQPERAELAKLLPKERNDGLTAIELDTDDKAWLNFS